MDTIEGLPSSYGLANHNLTNLKHIYWNLSSPALIEQVILRKEGKLTSEGAIVVSTGAHTGRSPNDKYIVHNLQGEADQICWGKINHPLDSENYQRIFRRMSTYFRHRDAFVQDLYVGAQDTYRIPVRVITERAWHSLFAKDLFIRPTPVELKDYIPEYTVIHAPGFLAQPGLDGTNSEIFIILDLVGKTILIGGTSYAGEIKKAVFSVMNYILPSQNVLSMHCSANLGKRGDVALFFGLSGTGKTTLSSDPERALIGDDEHGWSDRGVFNLEGGCYAKTIHLQAGQEPLIWSAARRFGSVLENVSLDPVSGEIDFNDANQTENTRAAYPLNFIDNHAETAAAGHPESIFFLTADAFGVIPPIARLTPDQAMQYYLSGYTAKLAGTEQGLARAPQATFSTCFAAPFLPLDPGVYARLLCEKIARHHTRVWLINTGWTGGPYGVGSRIPLDYTRAMLHAAIDNKLDEVPYQVDPVFGLSVPEACPGVPDKILNPRMAWATVTDYDQTALALLERFKQNSNSIEADDVRSGS
jgi:phosphoenolpyruvate carboxykinase (ATP)